MKERRIFVSVSVLVVVLALAVGLTQAQSPDPQTPAEPQATVGSAFTYQGQLSDGGNPANGMYDFQFILYNALVGGSQVGSTVAKEDVTVADGIFTTPLDFGQVFTGTALWLEAAVRAGSNTGEYTILSPRQEVTPAPYALYAAHAGGLSAADGDPMDAVTVDNAGTVTMSDLEVVRDGWASVDVRTSVTDLDAHIRLYDESDYWAIHNDDSEGNNLDIRYNNSSKITVTSAGDLRVAGNYEWPTGKNFELQGDNGEFSVDFADSDGNDTWHIWSPDTGSILAVKNDGKVGIGTRNPRAKLDVAGDVTQDLAANGLVKAGAYITITYALPSANCSLSRSFTTVEGGAVSAPVGMFCLIDFDFDLSQRYWVAMATNSDQIATCSLHSDTTRLNCHLVGSDGVITNGNFMLLVY